MLLLVAVSTFTACANDNQSPADARDKFVGTYQINQTCDNQPIPGYRISVSKSPQNESEIILQNLGSYGQGVRATVQGNTVTIPSQEVGAGMIGKVTLSGSGTLDPSDNSLDITLEVLVPAGGGGQSTSTCQLNGQRV